MDFSTLVLRTGSRHVTDVEYIAMYNIGKTAADGMIRFCDKILQARSYPPFTALRLEVGHSSIGLPLLSLTSARGALLAENVRHVKKGTAKLTFFRNGEDKVDYTSAFLPRPHFQRDPSFSEILNVIHLPRHVD